MIKNEGKQKYSRDCPGISGDFIYVLFLPQMQEMDAWNARDQWKSFLHVGYMCYM